MSTLTVAADGCSECVGLRARLQEAQAEVERLRGRPRSGPAGVRGRDARSRLIDNACTVGGLTRKELADLLGVDASRLAPSGSFPKKRREDIEEKLRALAAGSPLAALINQTQKRRPSRSRTP